MLSLVLLSAAYTFVDGVFGIVSAVRTVGQGERWDYGDSGITVTVQSIRVCDVLPHLGIMSSEKAA